MNTTQIGWLPHQRSSQMLIFKLATEKWTKKHVKSEEIAEIACWEHQYNHLKIMLAFHCLNITFNNIVPLHCQFPRDMVKDIYPRVFIPNRNKPPPISFLFYQSLILIFLHNLRLWCWYRPKFSHDPILTGNKCHTFAIFD